MSRYDDLRALLRLASAEIDRLRTDAADRALAEMVHASDFHPLGALQANLCDIRAELAELEMLAELEDA